MKRRIVYISPLMPSFSGGGLGMRAAHNLRALASSFEVYLLVISIYGGGDSEPAPDILQLCREWHRVAVRSPSTDKSWKARVRHGLRWGQLEVPPEWNCWEPVTAAKVEGILEKIQPFRIWVFRSYLLPWVWRWTRGGKGVWLDIDECESSARSRQAALLELLGKKSQAFELEKTAGIYRKIEKRWLGKLEKILASSPVEISLLRQAGYQGNMGLWPNVISSVPPGMRREPADPEGNSYRIFFVGSMGHFPNRDAVTFAAKEILARLGKLLDKPVTFQVAGAGSAAHRQELELPGVQCLGEVQDLGPCYARADLVIVPLRTGAGSRIKILEAFAYGCPVVSTSIGAEGLEVENGRELVLADDPDSFASGCAVLLKDQNKRERLVRAGTSYLKGRHDFEVLEKQAAQLAAEVDHS